MSHKENESNLWGLHAGRTGDADSLFLQKNLIAIGWSAAGDLSKLSADREAFKLHLTKRFTDKKPGAISNNAGQLFRFLHEMKPGDLVAYPSKVDRQIHIGRIEGPYVYDPSSEPSYPNRRVAKWLRSVPRSKFTQGALYEIGSAMSLF